MSATFSAKLELALPFPVMVPFPEVRNPISGTAFTVHFSFFPLCVRSVTNLCPLYKIRKALWHSREKKLEQTCVLYGMVSKIKTRVGTRKQKLEKLLLSSIQQSREACCPLPITLLILHHSRKSGFF
jgi:hypothetical protein